MTSAPASRADRRRTLVTSEGIALPLVLASRGSRLGALLIDLAIIAAVILAFTIAIILSGVSLLDLDAENPARLSPSTQISIEFLAIVFIAAMFLFRHGYFLFFELGPRGATPGKRLTGIRVAARGGGQLSSEMVLARNLLRDAELTLPIAALVTLSQQGISQWLAAVWLLIFALFPLFNADRLRPGDLVAGTWVVETPRRNLAPVIAAARTASTMAEARARGTLGGHYRFSDEELGVYGEYELQTLERVLREAREGSMIAVHAAICRKIGWLPAEGEEQAFLQAYYTQLRARLEAGMRMGRRKADKHS